MKYCINCGKKIIKNTRFCPYCGAKQNIATSSNTGTSAHTINKQIDRRPVNNYQNLNSQQQTGTFVKKTILPHGCSFIDAFKLFWKNYVNFGGYSSRSEFWWWFLIEYIIDTFISFHVSASLRNAGMSLFGTVTDSGSNMDSSSPMEAIIGALGIAIIWYIAVLIPNLSLRARRFRDAGMSNGWIVAVLVCDYVPLIIPIIGWIVSIVARVVTLVFELMPSVRLININK